MYGSLNYYLLIIPTLRESALDDKWLCMAEPIAITISKAKVTNIGPIDFSFSILIGIINLLVCLVMGLLCKYWHKNSMLHIKPKIKALIKPP